jgi:hypothetical protein
MQRKKTAQSVISDYRKRQQLGPFLIGGLAVILVVIGLFLLVIWLTGDGKPTITLFKSKTPTPTNTATVTPNRHQPHPTRLPLLKHQCHRSPQPHPDHLSTSCKRVSIAQ